MAGLNRMIRGRVLAEITGAVRGGKRRGPRKAPRLFGGGKRRGPRKAPGLFGGGKRRGPRKAPGGAVRRCRLVVVRGDTSAAFAVIPRQRSR